MIDLIYEPQESRYKAEYIVNNDILTVKIGDATETFDFTRLEEGVAEEIIVEELPINPIVSAEKIGDAVNITVIRFYNSDEKELFEDGTN